MIKNKNRTEYIEEVVEKAMDNIKTWQYGLPTMLEKRLSEAMEWERKRILDAVEEMRKEYTVEPPFSSNSEDYRKQSYNKALDDVREIIEEGDE